MKIEDQKAKTESNIPNKKLDTKQKPLPLCNCNLCSFLAERKSSNFQNYLNAAAAGPTAGGDGAIPLHSSLHRDAGGSAGGDHYFRCHCPSFRSPLRRRNRHWKLGWKKVQELHWRRSPCSVAATTGSGGGEEVRSGG